jgi:hypothetical protein
MGEAKPWTTACCAGGGRDWGVIGVGVGIGIGVESNGRGRALYGYTRPKAGTTRAKPDAT